MSTQCRGVRSAPTRAPAPPPAARSSRWRADGSRRSPPAPPTRRSGPRRSPPLTPTATSGCLSLELTGLVASLVDAEALPEGSPSAAALLAAHDADADGALSYEEYQAARPRYGGGGPTDAPSCAFGGAATAGLAGWRPDGEAVTEKRSLAGEWIACVAPAASAAAADVSMHLDFESDVTGVRSELSAAWLRRARLREVAISQLPQTPGAARPPIEDVTARYNSLVRTGRLELDTLLPHAGGTAVFSLPNPATPAAVPARFVASFRLFVGHGDGGNGVSFSYGEIPDGEYIDEFGAGSGLRLQLRTAGADQAALVFNETVRASVPLGASQLRSSGHDAVWRDVELRYADGAVEASLDGLSLFGKVPVPGFEPQRSWRFALGARTSALSDYHWVDDLRLRRGAGVGTGDARCSCRSTGATSQRERARSSPTTRRRLSRRSRRRPARSAAARSSHCAAPASRAWCLATPPAARRPSAARATLATSAAGACATARSPPTACATTSPPPRTTPTTTPCSAPLPTGAATAAARRCGESASTSPSTGRTLAPPALPSRATSRRRAARLSFSCALSRGRRRAARCSASRLPTASPEGPSTAAALATRRRRRRRPTPTGRASRAPRRRRRRPGPSSCGLRSTASSLCPSGAPSPTRANASTTMRPSRSPPSLRAAARCAARPPSRCRSRGCRRPSPSTSFAAASAATRSAPRVAPTGNSCATRPPRRRTGSNVLGTTSTAWSGRTAARRRGSILRREPTSRCWATRG